MDFLRLLESLRTPALNTFFSSVTWFGDELFFMVLSITVFWCFSKRDGYYILLAGLFGTALNQTMKLLFRVPRPWVLDPNFTVVESARAGAGGYSFPSGHTQNIVSTMTCVFLTNRNRVIRILAAALAVLVPFSRMYLGCHTPLDVSVAFAMALLTALLLYPLMLRSDREPDVLDRLLLAMLAVSALCWAFVTFYPFPADTDADNLFEGTKNAYTLLGSLLALLVGRVLDRRCIHFEVSAVWWAQVLKAALGLALLLAIKEGTKPLLLAVLPVYPATAVRYFLVVLFAAAGWPLTFRFFGGLGRRTAKLQKGKAETWKSPK